MNKYQDALNKIVENSCPRKTNCQSCEISSRCNCLMKDEVDTLQELVDKATPKKVKYHPPLKPGMADWYSCPCCGEMIGRNYKPDFLKHCSDCGQAIDGSEK